MLERVRTNMPVAADELAAHKLRDMALATAGKQDAMGARVSPTTFATDTAKLSDEAVNALYGANPEVARRLASLRMVGGSMKDTEARANASRTAGAEGFGKMLSGGLALQGYHMFGLPGAAAALTLPWLPGGITSRFLTSPTAARVLANPGVGGAVPKTLPAAVGSMPTWPGLLGGM